MHPGREQRAIEARWELGGGYDSVMVRERLADTCSGGWSRRGGQQCAAEALSAQSPATIISAIVSLLGISYLPLAQVVKR